MDGFTFLNQLLNKKPEFRINPTLENIYKILNLYDNIHLKIPVIHITGTNGKTSTALLTTSILSAISLRVGTFISPHLLNLSERILINGKIIPLDDLKKYCDDLYNTLSLLLPDVLSKVTFFEFITALAFYIFHDNVVDVAVIETGIGVDWDTTNVVGNNSKVQIISNIDYDHELYLGDTLLKIAENKSHIMKPNGICVINYQDNKVLDVLRKNANNINCQLYVLGKEFNIEQYGVFNDKLSLLELITIKGLRNRLYKKISLSLLGMHYVNNLACAIVASELFLGIDNNIHKLSTTYINKGISKLSLNGRFQVIKLKNNLQIIFDIAHNISGIKSLVDTFNAYYDLSEFNVNILSLIARDKRVDDILGMLSTISNNITIPKHSNTRYCDDIELNNLAVKYFDNILISENINFGIINSIESLNNNDNNKNNILIVTGGFYIVSETFNLLKQYKIDIDNKL